MLTLQTISGFSYLISSLVPASLGILVATIVWALSAWMSALPMAVSLS